MNRLHHLSACLRRVVPRSFLPCRLFLLPALGTLLAGQRAGATTYTLPGGSSAGWEAAVWTPAGFPNTAGDIAQYTTAATAATTALDRTGGGSITLGQLLNSNTGNWTITSGTSSGMVFDNTSGVGLTALISTSSSGLLTINPAITLQNTPLLISTGSNQVGAITVNGAIGGTGNLSLTGARAQTVITLGAVNNAGTVSVAVSTTGFTTTQFVIDNLGVSVASLVVGDAANPAFGGRLNLTGATASAFTGPVLIQGGATLATNTAGLNGGSSTNGITFGTGGGVLLSSGGIVTGKSITLNAAASFTTSAGGNDITLSGAITGAAGFTKRGNGNLILSGATSNAYLGDTTVIGGAFTGQLSLQKTNNAIAVPGDLVMDGTTTANSAGIGTAANTVRNQFGQQFGANSVIRFVNNTSNVHAYFNLYGNDQTVAGISELVASGGIIQNSQLENFAIDSVLTINNSADFFYTGYLRNVSANGTGTLGIIKTGAGKQTLAGVQITYTGSTTINQGILELNGATGFASIVTFGAGSTGILQIASAAQSIRGLVSVDAVSAGAIVQNAVGTNAVITVNQADDSAFGGVLRNNAGGNTLGLTKTGAGALTLAGSNTYTGTTSINGGVLALGSSGALGTSGTISFGGGILRFSAGNTTDYSSRFATTANQQFRVDTNGQTVTLAGNLTSSGGTLTKYGTGTLILSGVSAYTGDTTLNEGVLQIGGTAALTSSRNLIFAAAAPAGTTLRLDGFDTTTGTATSSGLISASTNAVIENGSSTSAATFTVLSGSAATYAGILRDGGSRALNFTRGGGASTLTLTGANTYTGVTTLNSGMLEVTLLGNGEAASGIGASTSAASNLVLNGGGLSYAGTAAALTDRQFTLGAAGGTLASNASSTAATVSFTSIAAVSFAGGGTRTLTLRGTNTGNNLFAGQIADSTGATSLAKLDAGAWVLTGASTYTGATTIGGGRLVVSGSLGGTAVAVNAGGTLSGTGTIGTADGATGTAVAGGPTAGTRGAIDLASGSIGSITLQGAAAATILTLGGATTGNASLLSFDLGAAGASDKIILSGGKLLVNAGGAQVDLAGLAGFGLGSYDLITFGAGQASGLEGLYLGATAGGGYSYSLVHGATATQVVVSDQFIASTWTVNAAGNWFTASNWSGSLVPDGTGASATFGNVITAPRTITLDRTATIGALSFDSSQAYTLAASGAAQLVLNNNGDGASVFVGTGSHTIAAPLVLAENTAVQIDGTQLTLSGVVSGSGRLIKEGAGTLVLSGIANTFSGGLSVTGGLLRISDDLSLGAVPTGFTAGNVVLNGVILESAAVGLHANRGITIGAGGLTLRVSSTMFANSVFSGTGQMTVGIGAGQYVPGGQSTYSGGTIFATGSKTVPIANTTGPAGAPTSGPFGTGTLTFAGGQMRATSSTSVTLANNVIISSDTTFYSAGAAIDRDLTFTGGVTLSGGTRIITVDMSPLAGQTGIFFTGAIGDGGNGHGLVKAGAGTLVLGGANTFTGGLVIRAGTVLATTNAAALGGSGTGAVTLGHTSGTAAATLLGGDATIFANAITVAAGSTGTATLGNSGAAAAVFSGAITLNKELTVASSGTGSVTLAGNITGVSLITVTGSAGNFAQFSGNNSAYSGDVAVASGTLRLGSATALNVNNTVALTAGATLDLNGQNSLIEGLNNGSGSGSVTNTGALATLTVGGNGSYTFGGVLGAGTPASLAFTKTGNGTQTLTGVSTYTGATTVNAGTLVLDLGASTTGVLSTSSPLVLGGGTLNVTGASTGVSSQALGALTLTAGTSSRIVIHAGGGAGTTLTLGNAWVRGAGASLFVDLSSGSAVLSSAPSSLLTSGLLTFVIVKDATGTGFGAINGSNQIVRAASDELRAGSNSSGVNFITQIGHTDYGGGATLTMLAGTHALNSLTINTDPGQGSLVLTGTSITLTSGSLLVTGTNNFSITGGTLGASGAALTVHHAGTGNLAISSAISGGAGSFTKTGAGTVTLSGTNTYTGSTTVSEGALVVSGGAAIADGSQVVVGDSATAVFQVNTSETIAALSGGGASGGQVVLGSGATLTSSGLADSIFAGVISGAGAFTKAGTFTLTLNNANTYAGLTTVSGGILRVTHASALGNTGLTTSTTVAAGARLELSGGITVVNEDISINGLGLSSQGGLHSGAGVNEWAGQVILTSDGARIGSSGTGTLVVSGKITDGVNTYGLAVRTNSLTNVVVISGAANDYGGITDVVVGTLRLAAGNNRLPTGTVLRIGNAPNVDGARFDLNGFNQEIAGLTSLGSTMVKNITSATAGILTINNSSAQSYDGTLTNAVSLVKNGAGTQTLGGGSFVSGTNTYTGATAINGGTLKAGSVNAMSANSAITLANTSGAALDVTNLSQVVGSLGGGGANGGNVTLGTATLTTGGDNTSTSYGGIISGAGGNLVKQGSGVFRLTGANTYTGTTTVSGGTLLVNGSTAGGGAVSVTATLGGRGAVGGAATIQSGGFLNPGDPEVNNGIGRLTFGNGLTLNSGSTTTLEIRGATHTTTNNFGDHAIGSAGYITYVQTHGIGQGDHDQISVSGSLVQQTGAGIDVVPVGFTAAYGQIFNLLDWVTALGSFSPSTNLGLSFRDGSGDSALDLDLPSLAGTGLVWDTSFFASDGILVVVPEPGRALLVLSGLVTLLLRRRRTT